MADASCIFCKIIEGKVPSKFVFSNERLVAFRDLNPQAPTHLLIVPRKHIGNLEEAEPGDQALLGEIQYVAKDLAKELQLQGFRLVLNNGKLAGQTVDHVHYHLLGGRRLLWPPG